MVKHAYLKNGMGPKYVIIFIMFQSYPFFLRNFSALGYSFIVGGILALASCHCNLTSRFWARGWWVGLHTCPFSQHLAVPVWRWKGCWDSQSVTPLPLLSLLRTNIRNDLVGFRKTEPLTMASTCCVCVISAATDSTGAAPVIDFGR